MAVTEIEREMMTGRELMYKYWGKAKKMDDGTLDWHLLGCCCLGVVEKINLLMEVKCGHPR